ncbi:MAG TPA: MerR family transcriptional regulator [Burkholderiaceae bacterium]|nr:MerR family transcriptional regulator [Burkholderiaceae bacterium]
MKRNSHSSSVPIAAVERDTGLSKDTLRVWERRYGFPSPERGPSGERLYPRDQLEKLRLLRRLLDAGHRPGKIIGLPAAQLQALASSVPAAAAASNAAGEPELAALLELVKAHQVDALRRALSLSARRHGLARFVIERVAPMNRLVGDAWASGGLELFEEHLYTESIQFVLRKSIAAIPTNPHGPLVLLTTLPPEPHGLGLLMAEAIATLAGARCVSLGVQTPVPDVVRAATAHRADVVALSFTGCVRPNAVIASLGELRARLPAQIAIWAGGSSPALRRSPPQVRVITDLADLAPAVRRLRDGAPE